MFDIKMGNILAPVVKTSNYGGLSKEDITELCVDRILSVAETAPPEIKEQAKFFKDDLKKVVFYFLTKAADSEKDRCIQVCVKGGKEDAADLLRRF